MRGQRTVVRHDPAEVDDPLDPGARRGVAEGLGHAPIPFREVVVRRGFHGVHEVVGAGAAVERLLEPGAREEITAHDVHLGQELGSAGERAHGPTLRRDAAQQASSHVSGATGHELHESGRYFPEIRPPEKCGASGASSGLSQTTLQSPENRDGEIRAFVAEMTKESAIGPNGYLKQLGLVASSAGTRAKSQQAARTLTPVKFAELK